MIVLRWSSMWRMKLIVLRTKSIRKSISHSSSGRPAETAEQRHEHAGCNVLGLDAAVGFGDECQSLQITIAERDQHASVRHQLVDQRTGNRRRRRGYQDRIVR